MNWSDWVEQRESVEKSYLKNRDDANHLIAAQKPPATGRQGRGLQRLSWPLTSWLQGATWTKAIMWKSDIFPDNYRSCAFGYLQIFFVGKSTVKTGFERIALVNLFLPVHHRGHKAGIGRIALNDQTIENQIGGAASQADLMTVIGMDTLTACG